MLAATCLFVWQDSTARILVKTYPVTEVAFVRYVVHIVLAGLFLAWRDLTTLFYTALAGTLCGGFLPFVAIVPTAASCGLMLFLGFAGIASHFCLIRAFAAVPANIIAPFGYISLLWATLFSLLIFAECHTCTQSSARD